jgi:hypothetical protein
MLVHVQIHNNLSNEACGLEKEESGQRTLNVYDRRIYKQMPVIIEFF